MATKQSTLFIHVIANVLFFVVGTGITLAALIELTFGGFDWLLLLLLLTTPIIFIAAAIGSVMYITKGRFLWLTFLPFLSWILAALSPKL